eukprot:7331529-Pyramimonas_sp.AAC.1
MCAPGVRSGCTLRVCGCTLRLCGCTLRMCGCTLRAYAPGVRSRSPGVRSGCAGVRPGCTLRVYASGVRSGSPGVRSGRAGARALTAASASCTARARQCARLRVLRRRRLLSTRSPLVATRLQHCTSRCSTFGHFAARASKDREDTSVKESTTCGREGVGRGSKGVVGEAEEGGIANAGGAAAEIQVSQHRAPARQRQGPPVRGGRGLKSGTATSVADGYYYITLRLPGSLTDGNNCVTLWLPGPLADGYYYVTLRLPGSLTDGNNYVTLWLPGPLAD